MLTLRQKVGEEVCDVLETDWTPFSYALLVVFRMTLFAKLRFREFFSSPLGKRSVFLNKTKTGFHFVMPFITPDFTYYLCMVK